jgi:P pilus assembly chaperone PapD
LDAFYACKRQLAIVVALLMSLASTAAYAGGVGLGATRVVYPSDSKQVSLSVANTDQDNMFLLQSWIESADGKVTEDFLITPPLFVIKKQSENTLRLVYGGPPLAEDRETLFWVSVKAIPSKNKQTAHDGQSTLQLAVVSRIKLFYRPKALVDGARQSALKVRVERAGDQLIMNNPTPYFVSLVKVQVGAHALNNTMIAPFSEVKLSAPKGASGEVTYSFVNDYGGVTKVK